MIIETIGEFFIRYISEIFRQIEIQKYEISTDRSDMDHLDSLKRVLFCILFLTYFAKPFFLMILWM